MELSKSKRARRSAVQNKPAAINFSACREIPLGIRLAIQRGLWLQGMHMQLQKTALELRDNPTSILSRFQKVLGRPSYFFTPHGTGDWVVLLGPRSKQTLPPEPARAFDFVVAQPSWIFRFIGNRGSSFLSMIRALHVWLMHPLIDTRV